ncbi:MAG: hypothetical protein ACKVH8_23510 [Pirellulales bacterium]|jgi:chemotaxis protein CheC
MNSPSNLLAESQLKHLEQFFHHGAANASDAMGKWLSVPTLISTEAIKQIPIDEAPEILGSSEEPVCFCSMEMTGTFTGILALAFDDECGLSITDMLFNNSKGTSKGWGEIECSAALETTNIIGCAYLNSLASHLSSSEDQQIELIPSPPSFQRDFSESILQSVFMEQALETNYVLFAKSRFEIYKESVNWTLLFIPDVPSFARLRELLSEYDV